jgi:hypothetical protein
LEELQAERGLRGGSWDTPATYPNGWENGGKTFQMSDLMHFGDSIPSPNHLPCENYEST